MAQFDRILIRPNLKIKSKVTEFGISRKTIGMLGFAIFCIAFMFRSLIVARLPNATMYLIYVFDCFLMLFAIQDGDNWHIRRRYFKAVAPLCAFAFLFVLLRNQYIMNHDTGTMVVWFYYFLFIIFISSCPKDWYFGFFKILMTCCLIAVFFVYLFFVFRDKYRIMYGIYQIWPTGTDHGASGYRAGITAHYSHNAMIIAMGVICLVSVLLTTYTKKNRDCKAVVMLLALSAFALLLTNKRAHLLFGTAAILFGYYIYDPSKRLKNFIRCIILAVSLLIIFVILANTIPFVNDLYQRFASAGEDSESMSRFTFWKLALSNFKEHPIIGIGWGGYQYEYHQHLYVRNPYGVDYPYLQAHNVYVQLLCECGITGTLMYLAIMFFAMKNTISILSRKMTSFTTDHTIAIFSIITQVFFHLYCLTGNCLYDMMFAYMAIAIGFSIGLHLQKRPTVDSIVL